ncbi:MAG: hypothetical protein PHZ23_14690 [Acidiphilium sp.]|nr:hypothetical protein [Acidiphilium sp.]
MTEKPILDLDAPGPNIIRLRGSDWAITEAVVPDTIERRRDGFQFIRVRRVMTLTAEELFSVPSAEKAS